MLIDLPVDNPETLEDMCVSVFDEDKYGKDESLGKCTIPVQVLRTAITSGQTQVQRLLFFKKSNKFLSRKNKYSVLKLSYPIISRQTQIYKLIVFLKDVWKLLEGVKRGSLHVQIGWSELKLSNPAGDLSSCHRAALVVIVDSCSSLLGGRTGLKLPNPRVKVEVCGVIQVIVNFDSVSRGSGVYLTYLDEDLCTFVSQKRSENVKKICFLFFLNPVYRNCGWQR